MGADEISFDELMAEETTGESLPQSFSQLLADGFPRGGGMAELAQIANLQVSNPKHAAAQKKFLQLLQLQLRAA
jgi:hypothetical protein